MGQLDTRIHGGLDADETKYTGGVPGLVLHCPATAHQGRQLQWSEDGSNVFAPFLCADEARPIAWQAFVWAEVAASMAWFVGFAPEGVLLDGSSLLDGDDLVGFYSAPGETTVQMVARRSGEETAAVLGTFSDGGMIALGLNIWGERKGLTGFTRLGETTLGPDSMPEASTGLALTVAATQTASMAREFAFWGMIAGQDRIVFK